jgi:hypothetical protein
VGGFGYPVLFYFIICPQLRRHFIIYIYWDITPCSPLKVNQLFGGTHLPHTNRLYICLHKHHYFQHRPKHKVDLHNTHTKENTQEIHEIRHGHVPCSRKKHSFQFGTIVSNSNIEVSTVHLIDVSHG